MRSVSLSCSPIRSSFSLRRLSLQLVTLLLMLPLATATTYADETGVAHLDKGTPAPFEGFLLSSDKAQKVRLNALDLEYQIKLGSIQTEENKVLQQRIDNCNVHTDALAKQVAETKDNGMLSKVGFFLLGAGAASLVAFGAARAVR